jgi:hypothetical protein
VVGVQLPGTVVKLSQSSESWENVRLEAVLLSHRPTSTFKVSTAGNESRDCRPSCRLRFRQDLIIVFSMRNEEFDLCRCRRRWHWIGLGNLSWRRSAWQWCWRGSGGDWSWRCSGWTWSRFRSGRHRRWCHCFIFGTTSLKEGIGDVFCQESHQWSQYADASSTSHHYA